MVVTMVDRRVAKALITAVRATDRHISITEVACQAAQQGLLPRDLIDTNGRDALIAIALALRGGPHRWPRTEPRGWEGAVHRALWRVDKRQTWRQQQAERRRHELQYLRARRSASRA